MKILRFHSLIKKRFFRIFFILLVGLLGVAVVKYSSFTKNGFIKQFLLCYPPTESSVSHDAFFTELATCAEQRTKETVVYDGSYTVIDFPWGDVDPHKGVCTDVIIRSYRAMGIDLQELLHYDIRDNFLSYPKLWRLTEPDTNIDHRRVPNLMVFFKRNGECLPLTQNPSDYAPGDIVAWDLRAGLMHIGMISTKTSKKTKIPLIVHNIGAGPVFDDMLFDYKIIGHFRFKPPNKQH